MDDASHQPPRLPLAAALERIAPPEHAALKPHWVPAIAAEFGRRLDSHGTVAAAAAATWNDLARLADGELVPAQLGGEENRSRRERLYSTAAELARPEHADLRLALTPILQQHAQAIKQALNGNEAGRDVNRKAVLDPNVMGYVFMLRQMHHDALEQQAYRLRAKFPKTEEATLEDAATGAFTAIVLNPKADLTRRDGGMLYTAMQNRMVDQFRADRRRPAIHLDQPEGEGLALSLTSDTSDPSSNLIQHEGTTALRRIATRLPQKERDAVTAMIESDGEIGPTELARQGGFPKGTASSRMHNARKHFRELAEADPETLETMQAFVQREAIRRRLDDDETPAR